MLQKCQHQLIEVADSVRFRWIDVLPEAYPG